MCESDRGMYKYCTVLHIANVFNHLGHIVNVHQLRITYFAVQKLINQLML